MKVSEIKGLNVTSVFSDPIDPSAIKKEVILDAIKERKGVDDVKNSGVEAPGLFVMMLPEESKEFIFEGNRVLVNDRSGSPVASSEIVDDFFMLIDTNLIKKDSVSSFGINIDASVDVDKDFELSELISDRLKKIPSISSAGVNLKFDKGTEKCILDIKPLNEKNKVFAHINIHFSERIPEKEDFVALLDKSFKEFSDLVEKI